MKRYLENVKKYDCEKKYPLAEAVRILTSMAAAQFDESVDIAVRLGVDPKQTDQSVRGAVGLPHGIGKTVRVAVFAKGEKADEAKKAGADIVGAEDLAEQVQNGFLDFDKIVATPDVMGLVGRLGKVLGPKGLMPNPKLGTVTMDVAKAIKDLKAGKVEFRIDKGGVVHAAVGKKSFPPEKIEGNITVFLEALLKAKPPQAKGNYFQSITISSTMGPGIKLDPAAFLKV